MTQAELSKATGIAQPAISKVLKQIESLSFVPKRVKKVIDALDKEIKIVEKVLTTDES
jgi:DNA-binding transcriptional regulator GbsR (MarR family)